MHISTWVLLVPVALFLLLWLFLLVRPLPLPFVADQARAVAVEALPESMSVRLGDTYLALEDAFAPVIRFSPVTLTDRATTGRVEMKALEIGFSPFRALMGQPGAIITMVEPKLQLVQDLFGPRLARFEIEEDTAGGPPTVRVLQGDQRMPSVGISSEGLNVRGLMEGSDFVRFRSDNEWLVYNLVASEEGLRSIVESAEQGLFSRLIVRGAEVQMHDSVYGLVRTFRDMELDIAPDPISGDVEGDFSAVIAGQRLKGRVRRFVDDEGGVHMWSRIEDMDFSSFVPFMDDPDAMMALRGTGDVVANIDYGSGEGITVRRGQFSVDMSGTQFRLQDDYFPVHEATFDILWDADRARFDLSSGRIEIGDSSADLNGTFLMGLDPTYGPTVTMTTQARNVVIHPNDMDAPAEPFEEMLFEGWSAPLYGALGIDRMVAKRGDMRMVTSGRADMLRAGVGFDLSVAMEGATADDLKRLWPYVTGTETRDWFVANVRDGRVRQASMNFDFPIGAVGEPGEEWRFPENSMQIGMTAENVEFVPYEGMDPILARGISRLEVDDDDTRIRFGDATIGTANGELDVIGAQFSILGNEEPGTSTFALEGNLQGPLQAVTGFAEEIAPGSLDNVDLPFAASSLSGNLDTQLSVRTDLRGEDNRPVSTAYTVTGSISEFASSEPIEGRRLSDGELALDISQDGYEISGPARIDGLETELSVSGAIEGDTEPEISIASTFTAEDLGEFGFDVGDILSGQVQFNARPLPDGGLAIDVDLTDAGLSVADIGISKPPGQDGTLVATARFDDEIVEISDIDLAFGTVSLQGEMRYHQETGLQSADFSQFAVSEGDSARLSLSPASGGYALTLRGEQLDLKPLLRRFFSLSGGGTGGPQSTAVDQTITLDAELDRALGFYSVTAFNLDTSLTLRGEDLRRVSLQANFGGQSSVSVTTNQGQRGRQMSVAFNDLGTLLRFGNVYSQLAGGAGTMVLNATGTPNVDRGQFSLREFAIVDEENVAQILGNHSDSRQLISSRNRLDFDSGRVSFVQRPDRIEITEAVLDGDVMGGTARGFIYTDAGQYDLAGTYVPLFGLNNAFQQLPLIGPLLGGREGEGLIGVTFAVRGDLDDPQFLVNPASALLPGAFRTLMEFRSRERPQQGN